MLRIFAVLIASLSALAQENSRDSKLELANDYASKRLRNRERVNVLAARLQSEAGVLEQLGLGGASFVGPGQEWWVAATLSNAAIARMVSGLDTETNSRAPQPRIYHFKVLSVSGDRASLRVTVNGDQSFDLSLNSRWQVSLTQMPIGGASLMLPLDYFPMALPQLPDADDTGITAARGFPALPSELISGAFEPVSFSSDRDGLSFKGIDGFGRDVQVVWRKGDPWPAYMSGAAGTAVLLRGAPQ